MHTYIFVNTVNLMNDLLNPKDSNLLTQKNQQSSQFSEKSMYIKEDDQVWGSAGMNNVQEESE